MRSPRALFLLLLPAVLTGGAPFLSNVLNAQSGADREVAGPLVSVSVEVDGTETPLYHAMDGSGRYYLEAREGSRYSVTVASVTSERLGVSLVVDGLDAISGEPAGGTPGRRSAPARMYVLEPWDRTTVRGWRTSLEDVRRFTFVDERRSYATRSGKSNAKMGWIEVLVYRERSRPAVSRAPGRVTPSPESAAEAPSARGSAPAPPPADAARGRHEAESEPEFDGASYPGTGWGPRADDPVILVDFAPERNTAERIVLRYEHLDALVALGVIPRPWRASERLAEREWGGEGFVRPPSD